MRYSVIFKWCHYDIILYYFQFTLNRHVAINIVNDGIHFATFSNLYKNMVRCKDIFANLHSYWQTVHTYEEPLSLKKSLREISVSNTISQAKETLVSKQSTHVETACRDLYGSLLTLLLATWRVRRNAMTGLFTKWNEFSYLFNIYLVSFYYAYAFTQYLYLYCNTYFWTSNTRLN